MTCEQAMAALKAGGSEQTRKTYARHGVDPAMAFGVSYAIIYKLAKQAGADQALAGRLWASGNHDARVLATHVADGQSISASTLEAWMKACRNYVQMDAVSTLAMRTPHAGDKARQWIDSKDEYIAAAGWNVVAGLAMAGTPDGTAGRVKKQESAAGVWDDGKFKQVLARIEREIAGAKNRVRHSMNNVLISVGLRGGAMREAAIAAAKRIGKVDVDHGDTSCKTPDAIEYIKKVEARRGPPARAAVASTGKSSAAAKERASKPRRSSARAAVTSKR